MAVETTSLMSRISSSAAYGWEVATTKLSGGWTLVKENAPHAWSKVSAAVVTFFATVVAFAQAHPIVFAVTAVGLVLVGVGVKAIADKYFGKPLEARYTADELHAAADKRAAADAAARAAAMQPPTEGDMGEAGTM